MAKWTAGALALALGVTTAGQVLAQEAAPANAAAPALTPPAEGAPEDAAPSGAPQEETPAAAKAEATPAEAKPAEAKPGEAKPEAAPAPAAKSGADATPELAPLRFSNRGQNMDYSSDRWETALDAKLTGLFSRSASNVTSPTMIFTALWNYRWPTDTYFGLTMSASPQPSTDTTNTGTTKRSFTTYYAGLNVAQGLIDWNGFRIGLAVSGGKGIVYVRETPMDNSAPSHLSEVKYNYLEPGGYITFYNYKGVDIGAVATYRICKLDNQDAATNSDLSSATYGLTFRTRGW